VRKRRWKTQSKIKRNGERYRCFSGGVDSTFLLKWPTMFLGNKVLAVTARSAAFPERELKDAENFASNYGIPFKTIISEELNVEGFAENPPNRCYLCKKELFSKIKRIAEDEGYKFVVEGSNYDDLGDYRPGLKAIEELEIVSPLREVGLTKAEIRKLSKEMGLKTWDKPSFACLSSRFPYGERITEEKLKRVDKAEQFLIDLGFKQVRVRYHGNLARIEVADEDFGRFMDKQIRNSVYSKFKELGFVYVSLDLMGLQDGKYE